MAGLISDLIKKFNGIVSPYKPKKVILPPVKKTSSKQIAKLQPNFSTSQTKTQSAVVKPVAKPPVAPARPVQPARVPMPMKNAPKISLGTFSSPPSAQRVNPIQPTVASQQINKNLITPFNKTVSVVNKKMGVNPQLQTASKNLQTAGANYDEGVKKIQDIVKKLNQGKPSRHKKREGDTLLKIPGEAAKSHGKTAERWATPEGRETSAKSIVKVLSGEVNIKDAINEPGVEDVLNFTDLLTLGTTGVARQGVGLTIKDVTKDNFTKYTTPAKTPDEKKAIDYISNNFEQAAKDYDKRVTEKFGSNNIIAADEAKYVIPDFEGTKSVDYHNASSAFSKVVYDQKLQANKGKGNNSVLFLSGGTGSGKTTALKTVNANEYPIIYDTNLAGKNASVKIKSAIDNGYNPRIMYVQRDPVVAFEEGVLPRVKKEGRIITINDHIEKHREALPTLLELKNEYGGKIAFAFIDNTGPRGTAKAVSFDKLPKFNYTDDELRRILNEKLDTAVKQNRITTAEANAIRGRTSSSGIETSGTGTARIKLGPEVRKQPQQKPQSGDVNLLTPFKKEASQLKQSAAETKASTQQAGGQKGSFLKSETQSSSNPDTTYNVKVAHSDHKSPESVVTSTTKMQSVQQKTETKKSQDDLQETSLANNSKAGQGDSSSSSSISDPVNKVIDAIKSAKPLNREQKALYSQERSKRIGKALAIGTRGTGEKGFFAMKGALKGELPKVDFEGVRTKLTQEDVDELFKRSQVSEKLFGFEKITVQSALAKIFDGQLPTSSEIKLLEREFGKELAKALLDKRSLGDKWLDRAGKALNIPRSLMSSFDLSAPLRQGALIAPVQPKQWLAAFVAMFKYGARDKWFKELENNIRNRPTYKLMVQSKLSITDLGGVLNDREEQFLSNWAEKIPLVGLGVKASGRAYTGFLNKLRADSFDSMVKGMEAAGLDVNKNLDIVDDIAKFINTSTGRGELPKGVKGAAPFLNATLFSPRLMASRLQSLNPKYYIDLKPAVRKQALKALFGYTLAVTTTLGLAKASGAEVEIDPRSADFAKIKVGNTRYDVAGGFQQYIRAAAQLITGQRKSTTTGNMTTLGEGYKADTRFDILQNFIESKESPLAAFVTTMLKGQNAIGEPVKLLPGKADINDVLSSEVGQLFTPMMLGGLVDLYNEGDGNIMKTLGIIPSLFGVGVQTYGGPKTLVSPDQAKGQGSIMLYKFMKEKMSKDAANKYFQKLQEEGEKDTINRLEKYKAIEDLGLSEKEMRMVTSGIKSGERAEQIANELNKLKTKKEKNDYIDKLTDLGIMDDEDKVWDQLVELKNKGKLNPQTDAGKKSQSLLAPFAEKKMVDSEHKPITQEFGNYNPAVEIFSGGVNNGTDVGVGENTPLRLPPESTWSVVDAYDGDDINDGYGRSILVENEETGEQIRLSHLNGIYAQPGDTLSGGELVATSGNTGNTTGPHVDIEFYDEFGEIADILKSRYAQYL